MINALIVYFVMIFLHILADFHLQGILARMKCKSYWDLVKDNKKYKNDYICSLYVHAFEWSFTILIPVLWRIYIEQTATTMIFYIILLIGNMVVHAIIDNKKANKCIISLCDDQADHLLQIFASWLFWTVTFGW